MASIFLSGTSLPVLMSHKGLHAWDNVRRGLFAICVDRIWHLLPYVIRISIQLRLAIPARVSSRTSPPTSMLLAMAAILPALAPTAEPPDRGPRRHLSTSPHQKRSA